MSSNIHRSEYVEYPSYGLDYGVVEVTRTIETEGEGITVASMARDLGPALSYLFKGLDEYENTDSWIEFTSKKGKKPRVSFLYKVYGERKATKDEKEGMKEEEARHTDSVEGADKATLKEIRRRNPHLFK